ncbi:MAG: transglutaminase family protein [Planctomycetota bacterium]|nr:transglutaminase family protein [Planctomycetota bacterium]
MNTRPDPDKKPSTGPPEAIKPQSAPSSPATAGAEAAAREGLNPDGDQESLHPLRDGSQTVNRFEDSPKQLPAAAPTTASPRPAVARPQPSSPAPLAEVVPLLDLLKDDSPSVRRRVSQRLLALGRRVHPALARAARGPDARLRGRARELLLFAERQAAARRLACTASRGAPPLESGLLRLERFIDPSLDARPYLKALDAMGEEVAKRAAAEPEGLRRPLALVDYLSGELSFSGFDPELTAAPGLAHVQLHRLLETKEGLPLTLCACYALVGRRAGFTVDILPLPGRAMVQLTAGDERVLIDPFDGGRPRTESDLVDYLAHHGLPYRRVWFRAAPDAVVLQHQIVNAVRCLRARGLNREAHLLRQALGALSRNSPGDRDQSDKGREKRRHP